MRLKRLLALAMAICMVAVMLPVTAMAAGDFIWLDRYDWEKPKEDQNTLDMRVWVNSTEGNAASLFFYGANGDFRAKSISIPDTKEVKFEAVPFVPDIGEHKGHKSVKVTATKADGKDWSDSAADKALYESGLTAQMTVTLINGNKVTCNLKVNFETRPYVSMIYYSGDNEVSNENLPLGTYTVKTEIVDKANTFPKDGWENPEWALEIRDDRSNIQEVIANGCANIKGSYPNFQADVTLPKPINDDWWYTAHLIVKNSDGNSKHSIDVSRGFYISSGGTPPPAVDKSFYILNGDEKVYSGSRLPINVSVNKNDVWDGKDFVAQKAVKSLSTDSASVDTRYVSEQIDGKYMGRIDIKVRDDDATPLVWEADDIEKAVKCNLTVNFTDGTKAAFIIDEKVGDRAFMSMPNSAELDRKVEFFADPADAAKNKYTYTMQLKDLGGVLKDSETSTEWTIEKGSDIAQFDELTVAVDKSGTAKGTLTVKGRGAVMMKIKAIFTHPDYKNNKSEWNVKLAVTGKAAPIAIGASDVKFTEGEDKVTLKVPSTNSLGTAALDSIKKSAADNKVTNVELDLADGIKMAIGVSGMDNADFLAAVEKNGGFDPLVILAPPAEVKGTPIRVNEGQWLDFAHNGALPGETTITLNADDTELFEDGDEVTMWQLKDGKLVKDAAPVTFDGEKFTVKLTHCSAWAIYHKGYDPNTGKPENGGGDDGDDDNDNSGGSSSGGGSSSAPSYPTADKGLADLAKIKDLNIANLPANAKLTKTAAGKGIAVIPVTLVNGSMGITDLNLLGKLGANVGLEIKQNGVDIIIPGGFGAITEVGRFSYPMAYSKLAANSADMLAAVKGEGAVSYTCTIGGNVTLPAVATVTLTTDIKKDGNVNVYRYDMATGKTVFVAKGKVVGGKVIFATKQLGQFMVTTGTV